MSGRSEATTVKISMFNELKMLMFQRLAKNEVKKMPPAMWFGAVI
jgi:hypothetical protein